MGEFNIRILQTVIIGLFEVRVMGKDKVELLVR